MTKDEKAALQYGIYELIGDHVGSARCNAEVSHVLLEVIAAILVPFDDSDKKLADVVRKHMLLMLKEQRRGFEEFVGTKERETLQ